MKKNTLYLASIILLLVLNLVQLGLFIFKPDPSEMRQIRKGQFEKETIHLLKLDKTQTQQFLEFTKKHHETIRDIEMQQKEYTNMYFNAPNDSVMHILSLQTNKKLSSTNQYFDLIQDILRPDQQEKFQRFKHQTIRHILGL